MTCGGRDKIWNTLSKCILQRKGNDSNHFPYLNLKRSGLSLTAISNKIFAIGGWPNSKTMETINLNTDKQWKKDELPFSVSEHCSIGLGNNIIVTGGLDENLNVSTRNYEISFREMYSVLAVFAINWLLYARKPSVAL